MSDVKAEVQDSSVDAKVEGERSSGVQVEGQGSFADDEVQESSDVKVEGKDSFLGDEGISDANTREQDLSSDGKAQ